MMNLEFKPTKQGYKFFLLALTFFFSIQGIHAQQTTVEGANSLKAYFKGKTKPLSELAPMPAMNPKRRAAKKANKPKFTPPNFMNWRRQPKVNANALPLGPDPVRQNTTYFNTLPTLIEPNLIIEGIDENTSNVGVPDTNGDASPDHYIQIVNASWFQIFDKDGTALTQPTSANTIWSQINQQSFSDPLISYDEAADRWLITDLANIDVVLYGVSETSDPMGAWNLYTLNTPGFADYPKYGVWPNAYVFTINEGQGVYPVYALNRQQMLDGAGTIDVQRIDIPGLNGGFPTATPMDWNSPTPPPNDDVYVVRLNDDAWGNGNATDELEIWSINIDWANSNNTTSTNLQLPTAAFDSDGCSVSGGFACIPQPGTTQGIDGIMTIVMNNVAYWNYGTHESAALCFSVDAGDDVAGVRWMELRRLPGGDWTIYQEATFAPDDDVHRFIPGISINSKGDIALAYSVSGNNTFPSLRYTGRRGNDPLGQMTVDEFEFATGEGVRTMDRYGDYARMSVDPSDDSFWFTSEYVKADGSFGTKIVNFSLGRDTLDISPISLDSPQNSPDLTNAELVSIQVKNLGLEPATNITVGYIFENGSSIVETAAIDTLFPDSIYNHTFISTVDMSTVGEYDFKIFSSFPEDENISNDTLRRVRQKLPRYDTGITNIDGLDGTLCDSTVSTTISLTNFGTETLTTVTIQYQLNNGTIQNIPWNGNLPTGESTTVTIVLDPLVSGTNDIIFNTLNPNGEVDEIPSNDNYSRDFQVVLGGVGITLTLTTDFYPEETTWQLLDNDNNIIFSGGPYQGQQFATITESWCVAADACYTFTIFDNYGDGMAAGPPGNQGSYSITNDDGDELASLINVNFGFEESNDFCVDIDCSLLAADLDVTSESNAGNEDGVILISVTSGTAPFTYSIDNGANTQDNPLFENLPGGIYNIIVTDANNCVWEQETTIETLVATSNLDKNFEISIFPNPSENGAFWLKVEGEFLGNQLLDLQVVDAVGKPVIYTSLSVVDGYYKGLVSLYNYPAGVYFIRFRNEKITELVKIIRL